MLFRHDFSDHMLGLYFYKTNIFILHVTFITIVHQDPSVENTPQLTSQHKKSVSSHNTALAIPKRSHTAFMLKVTNL